MASIASSTSRAVDARGDGPFARRLSSARTPMRRCRSIGDRDELALEEPGDGLARLGGHGELRERSYRGLLGGHGPAFDVDFHEGEDAPLDLRMRAGMVV